MSTGDDIEAPSAREALVTYAGACTVSGAPEADEHRGAVTGEHARGTAIIGADCSVDDDDDIAMSADASTAAYDRIAQEFDRRVQVSHGADDDGPVVNVDLTAALDAYEIQYRHNSDGVGTGTGNMSRSPPLLGPARPSS
jgi:hypothetical protein